MNPKLLLCSAGVLATCALAFAATAAPESIETSVKNMLKAIDAGDRASFHAYGPNEDVHFPIRIYDYDWDNKPVAIEGVAAVNTFMDSVLDEMAKRKLKVVSTVSNLRSDSRSPELGFAYFDLTQVATADGKSETSKYRCTALLTQDKKSNTWRMFHWHATLVPTAAK